MKLDSLKKINRLVIYFFYDADGIVDRYVPYMLEDINKNCTELFVVCNGKLTPEGRETFRKLTPNILVRGNEGFDVWAYKTALEHYGWDKLADFDEVVMMNFTMFGPVYPFSEMFAEMNSRDVDFWGITKHHGFPFDPFGTISYGYIPEHIQSSFICIRATMLKSCEFQTYWDGMARINTYGEAVGKHEAIFTKKFEECGFASDVYIQTDDLKKYTHYPLMLEALELVKNRRCPVFKRKSFTNEYYEFLNCCVGEPTVELYEYLRDYTNYDLNMVWDNLLRVDNMADIKNRMHLNYILPRDTANVTEDEIKKRRIALLIHLYFEDQIEYCMHYMKSMPGIADVFVTVCDEKMKQKVLKAANNIGIEICRIILVENRGRDVSALLVGGAPFIKDYDIVCFAHDKKTAQFEPYTIGKSFAYKCFENILGSRNYVLNVVKKFEEEPRLGMMMPPPPNHAAFFGINGTEWGSNYGNTLTLLDRLGLKVNAQEMKEPISPLGTMFWFRPKALLPILEHGWTYKDFPAEPNANDGTILHAIERAYGFVVQTQGYYLAWCMHDKFAAIELTNYHFMLRELAMNVYSVVGHQMGFATANYNFREALSTRKILKAKLKKRIPQQLWRFLKKIYHKFGGKKWVG